MFNPERPRHKPNGLRRHIRREKALARREALSRSAQENSLENPISQQGVLVRLLSLNDGKRSEFLNTLPEIRRGPAFDYEAVQRLISVGNDIRSGKVTDLGQVERILDRVGPLCGLFTAFGSRSLDMRDNSERLLIIVKDNLSQLTKGTK